MLAACSPMLPKLHISPLQTPVTLVGEGKARRVRQTEKYVFILSLTQVQELR